MHQLIPAAPVNPRATAGHLPALSVPEVEPLIDNLVRPWKRALANPRGHPQGFDTHVVSSNIKRISGVKISGLWRIGLSSKG